MSFNFLRKIFLGQSTGRKSHEKYLVYSNPNHYSLKASFWDAGVNAPQGRKSLEAAVYRLLSDNLAESYMLFPHISLREIFQVSEAASAKAYESLSFLAIHHVDFLFLNKYAAKPIAALELDGASHDSAAQKKSDAFKDNLFKKHGIALIRISIREHLNELNDLRFYQRLLSRENLFLQLQAPVYHYSCGNRMALSRNKRNGNYFYYCPYCKRQDGKNITINFNTIITDILTPQTPPYGINRMDEY